MLLTVVRHAESIENVTKHTSFYQDPGRGTAGRRTPCRVTSSG
ncbi:hypothetical protein ACIOHA_09375 [Streptomyces anulatus]